MQFVLPAGYKHMETKDRILRAAIDLFSDHGFTGASVRDICSRAEANIASINYYFGGKEALYSVVVKHVYDDLDSYNPMPRLADAPENPCGQLASWIDWYIHRQLDPKTERLARFIRREIADPTPMLQEMVDHIISPLVMELHILVKAILPEETSNEELRVHCALITGPTIASMICKPIASRIACYEGSKIDVESLVKYTQLCSMTMLKSSGGSVDQGWLTVA